MSRLSDITAAASALMALNPADRLLAIESSDARRRKRGKRRGRKKSAAKKVVAKQAKKATTKSAGNGKKAVATSAAVDMIAKRERAQRLAESGDN